MLDLITTLVGNRFVGLDLETGETEERKLVHASGEAEKFYRQFPVPSRIGMESTGNCQWFVDLLARLGHEVWIGDAAKIRASEVRQQMNGCGENVCGRQGGSGIGFPERSSSRARLTNAVRGGDVLLAGVLLRVRGWLRGEWRLFEVHGGAKDSREGRTNSTDGESVMEARCQIEVLRIDADGCESGDDAVCGSGN